MAETERDWPNESQYLCRCRECGNQFIGDKRRIVCRACTMAALPERTCPDCGEEIPEGWFHGCD